MNLIEVFNDFDSWTRVNDISDKQRSLWLAIVQLWNAAGRPCESSIPELKLRDLSGIQNKQTFYNTRNALEEFGLISVSKSKSKNIAPKYTLKFVSLKNSDDFRPNSGLEPRPISRPNSGLEPRPYTEERREEESREKDDVKNGSSFFDDLQKNLGRAITYPESEQARSWREDLSDEMIIKAVSIAALNRTTNFAYINTIIRNWINAGISTLSELQEHEEKREKSKKQGFVAGKKAVKSYPDWTDASILAKAGIDTTGMSQNEMYRLVREKGLDER